MDIALSPSALNIEDQRDNSFDIWQGGITGWVQPGNTSTYDAAFVSFDCLISIDSNVFLLGLVRIKESGILCLSVSNASLNSHMLIDKIIKKSESLFFKFEEITSGVNGEAEIILRRQALVLPDNTEFLLASHFKSESIDIFSKVFNHKIKPEFWCWKYGYDSSLSLIAFVEGIPCGHYGGINRPVMINQYQYSGLQACDVALLEKNRDGFLKSTFKFLALLFIRNAYASGVEFIYGFPHIRHMKLGERLGLYQQGEKLRSLSIKFVDNEFKGVAFEKVTFDKLSLHFNDCLLKFNTSLFSFGLNYLYRDMAYFIQRYDKHPEYHYTYHLSYDRKSVFVLKRNNKDLFVMDYIGSLNDLEFNLKSLFLSIKKFDGVICLWASDKMIENFFQRDSYSFSDYIACFSYSSKSMEFDGCNFFISMGDTDFI